MRGLALCLVTAALIAGCGSDDDTKDVTDGFGGTTTATQEAAVSAKKSGSPAQQCKGLSKKKPKGRKSKGRKSKSAQSPFAKCVAKAKAKAKQKKSATSGSGNGSAAGTPDDSGVDDADDSATDAAGAEDADFECTDAKGKPVAIDDPDVEQCDDSGGGSPDDDQSPSTDDGPSDAGDE